MSFLLLNAPRALIITNIEEVSPIYDTSHNIYDFSCVHSLLTFSIELNAFHLDLEISLGLVFVYLRAILLIINENY